MVGPEHTPLAAHGAQPAFLEAYDRLASSWIRLELKRRWGVMREKPTLLDSHKRLIRAAHVIRELGLGRWRHPTQADA